MKVQSFLPDLQYQVSVLLDPLKVTHLVISIEKIIFTFLSMVESVFDGESWLVVRNGKQVVYSTSWWGIIDCLWTCLEVVKCHPQKVVSHQSVENLCCSCTMKMMIFSIGGRTAYGMTKFKLVPYVHIQYLQYRTLQVQLNYPGTTRCQLLWYFLLISKRIASKDFFEV
jgi:hypothetical protein